MLITTNGLSLTGFGINKALKTDFNSFPRKFESKLSKYPMKIIIHSHFETRLTLECDRACLHVDIYSNIISTTLPSVYSFCDFVPFYRTSHFAEISIASLHNFVMFHLKRGTI